MVQKKLKMFKVVFKCHLLFLIVFNGRDSLSFLRVQSHHVQIKMDREQDVFLCLISYSALYKKILSVQSRTGLVSFSVPQSAVYMLSNPAFYFYNLRKLLINSRTSFETLYWTSQLFLLDEINH